MLQTYEYIGFGHWPFQLGIALIRISFMHDDWTQDQTTDHRLLFYFSRNLFILYVYTRVFYLSPALPFRSGLLWLSCFIQQLMRKLAVVWIIYNSTHMPEDGMVAVRGLCQGSSEMEGLCDVARELCSTKVYSHRHFN